MDEQNTATQAVAVKAIGLLAVDADEDVCILARPQTDIADPEGLRARTVFSYGNASQSNSPHIGDQPPLLERKTMREVKFVPVEED